MKIRSIIRLCRMLDAAYCYRRSSVVCWPFCLLVDMPICLPVTTVNPSKTAEPIEMLFGYGLGWSQGTMY